LSYFLQIILLIMFVYLQFQQPCPESYSKESYANSSLGRWRIIAMVQNDFQSVIRPYLNFHLSCITHIIFGCRKQIIKIPVKPMKVVMYHLFCISNLLTRYVQITYLTLTWFVVSYKWYYLFLYAVFLEVTGYFWSPFVFGKPENQK
jgi:hypothetical protein